MNPRLEPPDEVLDNANCIGEPVQLFDVHGSRQTPLHIQRRQHKAALTLCHTCPVILECRLWALQIPDPAYGLIAGGLLPRERTAIRRQHQRGVA